MVFKKQIKYILSVLVFCLSFFVFSNNAHAENIKLFEAIYGIQQDGIVNVLEKITYDFGSNQKHGIFRDIPLTSNKGPDLGIKVNWVRDVTGKDYIYTTSNQNAIFEIKIGEANKTISGVHDYIINYDIVNAIRPFTDHDEFYWNVTGNEWLIGIEKVGALVTFSTSSLDSISTDCFTGTSGSTEKNCTISGTNFETTKSLGTGEGLTIVVGFPSGLVILPSTLPSGFQVKDTRDGLDKNLISWIIYSAIFFMVFFFKIIRIKSSFNRKPKPVVPRELKGKPVVVQYQPPENLPPIEIGTISDRRVDPTDISATIIDLAIRGYLKIKYSIKEIPFWPDKKDYEFTKLKSGDDLVNFSDKGVLDFIFFYGDNIKLSDLKKYARESPESFEDKYKGIKMTTEINLRKNGYFEEKNNLKKYGSVLIYGILGIITFIIAGNLLSFSSSLITPITIISFIMVMGYVFSFEKEKLTSKGLDTMAMILGFQEFLQLTEKDKLNLLNAPELKPELFEKFLPYAMVLGVEEKWAKQFEGIYNNTPYWFEDASGHPFTSMILINNLANFKTSYNLAMNISAAGSSSELGGGGFSGGGSGGGGGGSW
jgi:uncharacterized membrane protein